MDGYIFPALVEKFVAQLQSQGKSSFTIVAYKKDLEQFIGYLSSREINDIRDVKKPEIEGFIAKLITENYTKKSASRKLNSIRTFFRHLKSSNIIEQNPSLEVSHPKYIQTPPRIFSKLEYRAIRDVAKEDPRTYAVVEILLQTGVRIGELTSICVSDVKESIDDYLAVRGSQTSPDDLLFVTRTGKGLLIRNVRQIIMRCFKEVGIENATINDFRNTFIAHQLMAGYSIDYIAKIVGHKRLSSTERFLSLVKETPHKKDKIEEL